MPFKIQQSCNFAGKEVYTKDQNYMQASGFEKRIVQLLQGKIMIHNHKAVLPFTQLKFQLRSHFLSSSTLTLSCAILAHPYSKK